MSDFDLERVRVSKSGGGFVTADVVARMTPTARRWFDACYAWHESKLEWEADHRGERIPQSAEDYARWADRIGCTVDEARARPIAQLAAEMSVALHEDCLPRLKRRAEQLRTRNERGRSAQAIDDDRRPADWFFRASGELLEPATLRMAVKRGRLGRSEKHRGRWQHSVAEVIAAYPQHAEAIRAYSESEPKRTAEARKRTEANI